MCTSSLCNDGMLKAPGPNHPFSSSHPSPRYDNVKSMGPSLSHFSPCHPRYPFSLYGCQSQEDLSFLLLWASVHSWPFQIKDEPQTLIFGSTLFSYTGGFDEIFRMAFEGASKWDNVQMNNYFLINRHWALGVKELIQKAVNYWLCYKKSEDGIFPLFTEKKEKLLLI